MNQGAAAGLRPQLALSVRGVSASQKREFFYNFVPFSYVTTETGAITSQTAPLSARPCSSAELAAMYLNCSIITDEHAGQLEWKCNQQVHALPAERSIQFSVNNEKNLNVFAQRV